MRQPRFPIVMLLLVLSAFFASGARADVGMRCGTRLITTGDFMERVRQECGAPSHVETWEESRLYRFPPQPFYRDGDTVHRYGPADKVLVHVLVEVWTYNHGPHRFMDRVRFENGRVSEIVTDGYGY